MFGDNQQVFKPTHGTTCDRSRGYCYDRYGIDLESTYKYLGHNAAERTHKRYGDQAYLFSPRLGVTCDRRTDSCSDGNGLSVAYTHGVFGGDDSSIVSGWQNADNFSPRAGVVCIKATLVCSQNGAPNVDLTQLYYGRAAATDLANQLGQNVPRLKPAAVPDLPPPDAAVTPTAQDAPPLPEAEPTAAPPVDIAMPIDPVTPVEVPAAPLPEPVIEPDRKSVV